MTTQNIPKLLFICEDTKQLYDKRFRRNQVIITDQNDRVHKNMQYQFHSEIKLDTDYEICQNQEMSTSIFNTVYSNAFGMLYFNTKAGVCAVEKEVLGGIVKSGKFVPPQRLEQRGSLFLSPSEEKLLVLNDNSIHVLSLGSKVQRKFTTPNNQKLTNACWQSQTSLYLWSYQNKLFFLNLTSGQQKQVATISKCSGVNRINSKITIALQGVTLHILKNGELTKSISLQMKYKQQPLFQFMVLIGIQKLNNLQKKDFHQSDLYVLVGVYYTAYEDDDKQPCHRYAFFMRGSCENQEKIQVRGIELFDSAFDDQEYYLAKDQITKFPFSCIISVQENFTIILVEKMQKIFFIDATEKYEKMRFFSTWPKHGFQLDTEKTKNKFLKGLTIMKNMFEFEKQAVDDNVAKIYCNDKYGGQFMRLFFSEKEADLTIQFPLSAICFSNSYMIRKYAACTVGACEDDNEQEIVKYIQEKKKSRYILPVKPFEEDKPEIVEQKKEQLKFETKTGDEPKPSKLAADSKTVTQVPKPMEKTVTQVPKPEKTVTEVPKPMEKTVTQVPKPMENKPTQAPKSGVFLNFQSKVNDSGQGSGVIPGTSSPLFGNSSWGSTNKFGLGEDTKKGKFGTVQLPFSAPGTPPVPLLNQKGGLNLPMYGQGGGELFKSSGSSILKGFGSLSDPNSDPNSVHNKLKAPTPLNIGDPKNAFNTLPNEQKNKMNIFSNPPTVSQQKNTAAPATTPPKQQPVQPAQPAQPAQPVQPVQPVKPVQPVQPVQPAQPAQPVPVQPKINLEFYKKSISQIQDKIRSYREDSKTPELFNLANARKLVQSWNRISEEKNKNLFHDIVAVLKEYDGYEKIMKARIRRGDNEELQSKVVKRKIKQLDKKIDHICYFTTVFQKSQNSAERQSIFGPSIKKQPLDPKSQKQKYISKLQKRIKDIQKHSEALSTKYKNQISELLKKHKISESERSRRKRLYQFEVDECQIQSDSGGGDSGELSIGEFQKMSQLKRNKQDREIKEWKGVQEIREILQEHKEVIQFCEGEKVPIFTFTNLDQPKKPKTIQKKQAPKPQTIAPPAFQTSNKPFDQKLQGLVGSKQGEKKFIPPNLSKNEIKKQNSVKASENADSGQELQIPQGAPRTISQVPIGGVKDSTTNKQKSSMSSFTNLFAKQPEAKNSEVKEQKPKMSLFGDQKLKTSLFGDQKPKGPMFGEIKDTKPALLILGNQKPKQVVVEIKQQKPKIEQKPKAEQKPKPPAQKKEQKPKAQISSEIKAQKPKLIFGVDSMTFNMSMKQAPKQEEKKAFAGIRSFSPKLQQKTTVPPPQQQNNIEEPASFENIRGIDLFHSGFSMSKPKQQKPEQIKPIVISTQPLEKKSLGIKDTVILTQPASESKGIQLSQPAQQKKSQQPLLPQQKQNQKLDLSAPASQNNVASNNNQSPPPSSSNSGSQTPVFKQTQQNTIRIPEEKAEEPKKVPQNDEERQKLGVGNDSASTSKVSAPSITHNMFPGKSTSSEANKNSNTTNSNSPGGLTNSLFKNNNQQNPLINNTQNQGQQNQPAFPLPPQQQQQQQAPPAYSQNTYSGNQIQGHASMTFGGGNRFSDNSGQQAQTQGRFNPNEAQNAFSFTNAGPAKSFSSIGSDGQNPFNRAAMGNSWLNQGGNNFQTGQQGFMNNQNNQFNQGNTNVWQSQPQQNQQQQNYNQSNYNNLNMNQNQNQNMGQNMNMNMGQNMSMSMSMGQNMNMFSNLQNPSLPANISPSMMQPRK